MTPALVIGGGGTLGVIVLLVVLDPAKWWMRRG